MTNPYVGLRPFTTAESRLFFGRNDEARILASLAATLPVLVVYAPSGTGKSSLINAGLAPLISADSGQLPVFAGTHDDIRSRVRLAVAEAGWQPSPTEVNLDDLDLADLMLEFWKANDRRVVILLDQVEDRLNAATPTEDLFAAIAKLVHSGSDAACVVLSIREDYLGSLEPLMRLVPGLLNGGFRVPRLSRSALESAVFGPLESVGADVEIDRAFARLVLDDLEYRVTGQQEPGEQRFEPGYFQIVWSTIWEAAAARGFRRIDLPLYKDLGGAAQILQRFIGRILDALEPAQAQIFWAMARYLVLPTGAKVALTVEDLVQLIRPTDHLRISTWTKGQWNWIDDLTKAELTKLIRGVFQRLTANDAPVFQRAIRSGREEFELLHDLLGHIMLDWRQRFESSARDARTAEKLRKAARASIEKAGLDGRTFVSRAMPQIEAVLAELSDPAQVEPETSKGRTPEWLLLTVVAIDDAVRSNEEFEELAPFGRLARAWADLRKRVFSAVRAVGLDARSEATRRRYQAIWAAIDSGFEPKHPVTPPAPRRKGFPVVLDVVLAVMFSGAAVAFGYVRYKDLIIPVGIHYGTVSLVVVALVAGVASIARRRGRSKEDAWSKSVGRVTAPPILAAIMVAGGVVGAYAGHRFGWPPTVAYDAGLAIGLGVGLAVTR